MTDRHAASDERASARQPFLGDAEAPASPTSAGAPGASAISVEEVRPLGFFGVFRYASRVDVFLIFLGLLGAAVNGCTQVAFSFFMQDLVTSISEPIKEERDRKVLHNLVLFLGVAAVSFCGTSCMFLGFATAADNQTQEVRRRFFSDLMHKSVGWYDTNSAAQMSTRLTNDTYDYRQGIGEKFGNMFQGIAMSLAGISVGFYRSWKLTLVMLCTIPVSMIVIGVAAAIIRRNTQKQQEFYAKAGGVAETSISSIRTVAAFGGYKQELQKYEKELAGAWRKGVWAGLTGGVAQGIISLSIYGVFALGFFVGSIFVVDSYEEECWVESPPFGSCFTGGHMVSTVFAVFQGGMGLATLAPNLAVVAQARSAAARIFHVLDQVPIIDASVGLAEPAISPLRGEIEFRNVWFSYPTRLETKALEDVSLSIPAGTTAAFVGPSGSGKSTAVALLQRFYDASSGEILVDGNNIRALKLSWLRSQMSLVQQEPVLFAGSISENIAYGYNGSPLSAEALQHRVQKAAEKANAHSFISAFPDGYKTEVGERGLKMSGGQKQRVAIARAIIRDPKVLLLDEATSALDTESERVVQEALDKLLADSQRTTVVIAHRLSTIQNADVLFVLENGRLVESGTHNQLVAKAGLYAQLVELQQAVGLDAPASLLRTTTPTRQVSSASTGGRDATPKSRYSEVSLEPASNEAEDRDTSENHDNTRSERPEIPVEDEEDVPVPMVRLLKMQCKETGMMLLALLATILVGASSPLIGRLFSDTIGTLSQPPVIPRTEHGQIVLPLIWDRNFDADDLRTRSHRTSLEYIVLGSIVCISAIIQNYGFRKAAETLTLQLRKRTFEAMLRQEIAWFDARSSGELADRLASEAPLIKAFTGEAFAAVLQVLVTVCTGFAIAFSASWSLTLCFIGFLPILTIGNTLVAKYYKKTNKTRAGPVVSEAVGNMRTIAAFSLEDKMMERYANVLGVEAAHDRRSSFVVGLASAYTSAITLALYGFIMFVANIFIDRQMMHAQDAFQVLFPVLFMASGLSQASVWFGDRAKAKKAVNHIFHTIDRAPVIDAYAATGDTLQHVRGQVQFKHVRFRYPTRPDTIVLSDFSLTVEPTTKVAFVGPSGSGKSTTIALLQRYYDPDSGQVCLDGRDIKSLNIGWLRRQMALVQQEPILFVGTIYDNIVYGESEQCCISRDDVEKAAAAASAHSFITDFPNGYDTDVGERGSQLSGGQKQRIAIARAMIRKPSVLLLDEATSALDTESERVVQEALDKLLKETRTTTLIIAHRLSTIKTVDTIFVIYQGQIVEKGSHEELLKIPDGQYKKLVERQLLAPSAPA